MSVNIDESLKQIRKDFFTLQSRGPAVFGAKSHLYRLNDPLTEETVKAFEHEHGITLPEDYRLYLTDFADGGAGPAYGVYPLAEAFTNPWISLGPLSKPFEISKEDDSSANYHGCLLISQRGWGGWTFLIVTGPMRGQVWYDDSIAEYGFSKAADSFLEWFESWISDSLDESANQPHQETAEFVDRLMDIIDTAPEHLEQVLNQEPDETWLLAPLLRVGFACMQANNPAQGLLIYQRLLRYPPPENGELRDEYLKGINNAIIAACLVQDFTSATTISDMAQDYVEENPYITHSAACAYMGKGDQAKALKQCKLAVALDYEHLDQLEADPDLAPLHDNPEFKKLFA